MGFRRAGCDPGWIYAGIFTPTESAAVAVVYGVIVGFFINRNSP